MAVRVESRSKRSTDNGVLLSGAEVESKEFKQVLEPGHVDQVRLRSQEMI